jgi:hypothetical protein
MTINEKRKIWHQPIISASAGNISNNHQRENAGENNRKRKLMINISDRTSNGNS